MPIKIVRVSLSVTGICFAVAWLIIALISAGVIRDGTAVQATFVASSYGVAGLLHVAAFCAITTAMVYGISALIRYPHERCAAAYSAAVGSFLLWAMLSFVLTCFPSIL